MEYTGDKNTQFTEYNIGQNEQVFFNNVSQSFIIPATDWDLFILRSLTTGVSASTLAQEISSARSVPYEGVLASISDMVAVPESSVHEYSNEHLFNDASLENPLPCVVAGFRSFEHTSVIIGFQDHADYQAFERVVGQQLVEVPNTFKCDVLLSRAGNKYSIRTGSGEIDSQLDLNMALLFALNATVDIAAKRKNTLFIAHAGAVYDKHTDSAAIFPALGHAGKSTLMCSLALSHYTLINDDVVPVSRDGRLHCISLVVKLREGSWDLFDTPIEPLCTGHIFKSANETQKLVDFERVSNHKIESPAGFPARYLIVPSYSPTAESSVQRLSTSEALRAIVDAESIFHKPAAANDITAILRWLEGLTCYQIQYSSLAIAHSQNDEIFQS